MCNFMGVKISKIEFIKLKQIEKELGTLAALSELEIMKDGFKYSNAAIIRKVEGKQDIELVSMHWEFIPPWIKSMAELKDARKQGIPWLNATSEKLLDSKMFKSAALKRRCLVLATHFFEWRHYKPDGEKKSISYPYVIDFYDKEAPRYFAGIWQPWTDKETGEIIDTFAIITTKANDLMEVIHNTKKRMPTILTEDLAYEWLMEDLSEERIREISSFQLPSEYLQTHTIAKDFKITEDPLKEFYYENLPALDIEI
jgi:putative SOS response-associated peptidase YedK